MENYQEANNTIKRIGKGIGISMMLTLLLLLVFSIILTYTNISENTITPVIIVTTSISILIRKFYSKYENKKERINKWCYDWWTLYANTLYNFKSFKLEIRIKYTKHNNDRNWNYLWDIRRDNRSKYKIKQRKKGQKNRLYFFKTLTALIFLSNFATKSIVKSIDNSN